MFLYVGNKAPGLTKYFCSFMFALLLEKISETIKKVKMFLGAKTPLGPLEQRAKKLKK